MKKEIVEQIRREYTRDGLRRADASPDPIAQFEKWFEDAVRSDLQDVTSMTLATASPAAEPSARIVLLKSYDDLGFVYYGNYESRKSKDMVANPQAALLFYWRELERQVRIRGTVSKVAREESETYWKTRPRESQVGAWASQQSHAIANRAELEKRFDDYEAEFKDRDVPLPPTWGGFLLTPIAIEFWQGRAYRLHDRLLYSRQDDGTWKIERLAP